MPTLDPQSPVSSLLTASGLTQRELADRMDSHQSTIARAAAKGREISYSWLLKAAERAGFAVEIRLTSLPHKKRHAR